MAGCAHQAPKPDPVLTGRIDEILHRQDGRQAQLHFGARVVDLASGREIYGHDIDEPLMPASNGKLAVGATGLDMFGPSHTFKTYLARDGYDLWLIGTGDPAPGDLKIAAMNGGNTLTILEEWTDALRRQGITRIRGDLVYYDRAFESLQTHPTWSRSFAGDWYAAPVGGLNFNDNCIDVTVMPTKEGELAKWSVMPPARTIHIINHCTTAARGSADIDRDPDANVFTLKGAATRPTTLPSKSITDPGAFFADALRTYLETHGITIDGRTRRAEMPLDGKIEPSPDKLIAVHATKLTDMLWRINKNSQNMFAEAMCKLVGREYMARKKLDVPGSWENGALAVRTFLNEHRIDTTHYALVDGSGLSRDNRVTARLITDVFVTMYHHPYHEAFKESLSVAGEDGTLRDRMMDIRGHFFGKTGYIGGVRSLSGYVKTNSGRWLAVSIIYNGIEGTVKPAEQMQDDVIRLLVNDSASSESNVATAAR